MILVDTSVWIEILKDKEGYLTNRFRQRTETDIVVFNRFIQLELLQGSKDEFEWRRLDDYLATQNYLEASKDTWRLAARTYFDLRRSGIKVRSPVDCCIAYTAMEANALLLHRDRDFDKIAQIRPLDTEFFKI